MRQEVRLTPDELASVPRELKQFIEAHLADDGCTVICDRATREWRHHIEAFRAFLQVMHERRVRRHALYPALLRVTAQAYRSSGLYAARWRRFRERGPISCVGRPYPHDGRETGFSDSIRRTTALTSRMIAEVFPRRWDAEDDMRAAIVHVARTDLDARRIMT